MLVQVREGQSTSLHPLNNRVSKAQLSQSHFEFVCGFLDKVTQKTTFYVFLSLSFELTTKKSPLKSDTRCSFHTIKISKH